MSFTPIQLLNSLQGYPRPARYCIAFSGGLDSSVLLAAMHSLRAQLAPADIVAFHINHGLQPAAQHWSEQCTTFCRDLGIECRIGRIEAAPQAGDSIEAAARQARYALFEQWLQNDDLLLTAHHQDDQAETMLLQLLRGAGVHGLAAMPSYTTFGRAHLARPLLSIPRSELQAYAMQENLPWVDDPSNADVRFDRNYLRHRIMPLLRANWPASAATLARSAGLCADAAALLDDLAEIDLEYTRVHDADNRLSVPPLLSLSDHRVRNLLRYWIPKQGFPPPNQKHLHAIVGELLHAKADAEPMVCWPGCEIRRYRDNLFLSKPVAHQKPESRYRWNMEQELMIPGCGRLSARQSSGVGISRQRCTGRLVEVSFRRGGERLRPTHRGHHRTLKNLLQEAGIPPWERNRLPLIFIDGELAAVANRWIDTAFAAAADEPGWQIVWRSEGED